MFTEDVNVFKELNNIKDLNVPPLLAAPALGLMHCKLLFLENSVVCLEIWLDDNNRIVLMEQTEEETRDIMDLLDAETWEHVKQLVNNVLKELK